MNDDDGFWFYAAALSLLAFCFGIMIWWAFRGIGP